MTLIDNAVYVGGQRVATPRNLDETYTLQEAHTGFAWIGLYRPTAGELASVAAEFDGMLGQHLQKVGMVMPSGLSQDVARS